MVEMIRRSGGDGVAAARGRDPYRPVRQALADRWELVDRTDPAHDLGVAWFLAGHPLAYTVRLSYVGPYAVVLRGDVPHLDGGLVTDTVRAAGFTLLPREILERRVEGGRTVYELLLERDLGLPWHRR
jgi:hypothetical protein